jgi:mycobactin lysine-N-oxygenase
MTDASAVRADVVVLGAGPKAAAIASKAQVLAELGYGPLRIVVVEQREAGASWTGRHGFTTGYELLGTRPEKDVGFPYQSGRHWGPRGQEIDRLMLQFSWQSHLVETRAFRHWVDAGAPYPEHHEVARYVAWVLARATRCTELRLARVTAIGLRPEGWLLSCETAAGERHLLVAEQGLVVTGPGVPRPLACAREVAHRVVSPAATAAESRAIEVPPNGRVCVVGSGESAVSLALSLVRELGDGLRLTFVAPSLPLTRSESFLENSVYSDAQVVGWRRLSEADRQEFIRRTDRGVMSPDAVARLARHRNLSFVLGRVREVRPGDGGRARVVVDQAEDGGPAAEPLRQDFDLVANCMGACTLTALLGLLGETAETVEQRLGFALSDEVSVKRALDPTLALAGLTPRLHLPALAGLAHGPGFANLSCLSSLSDHVLSAYLADPVAGRQAREPQAAIAAICAAPADGAHQDRARLRP